MDLCIECNIRPIYIKKRKLCGLCYNRLLKKGGNAKQNRPVDTRSPREIKFAEKYFSHKNWIYHPATFNLGYASYTPDFYDGENNVFIEVVGTRQAYHRNKDKYASFEKVFPLIKLEIRTTNGELLKIKDNYISWLNPKNYNYQLFEAIKDAGLTQQKLAKQAGLSEVKISYIINGNWNMSEEEKRKIETALGKKIWKN